MSNAHVEKPIIHHNKNPISKILPSLLFWLIIVVSCGPKSSSNLQTLGNFTRNAGTAVTNIPCAGSYTNDPSFTSKIDTSALQSYAGTNTSDDPSVAQQNVLNALTAIPPNKKQGFFSIGKIKLDTVANTTAFCQTQLSSSSTATADTALVTDNQSIPPEACWELTATAQAAATNQAGNPVVIAHIADDPTVIDHLTVKLFGFLEAQIYEGYLSLLQNVVAYANNPTYTQNTTTAVTISQAFNQKLTLLYYALIFDLQAAGNKSAVIASLNSQMTAATSNPAAYTDLLNQIYAETFDSAYCTTSGPIAQNTNAAAMAAFPNTMGVFNNTSESINYVQSRQNNTLKTNTQLANTTTNLGTSVAIAGTGTAAKTAANAATSAIATTNTNITKVISSLAKSVLGPTTGATVGTVISGVGALATATNTSLTSIVQGIFGLGPTKKATSPMPNPSMGISQNAASNLGISPNSPVVIPNSSNNGNNSNASSNGNNSNNSGTSSSTPSGSYQCDPANTPNANTANSQGYCYSNYPPQVSGYVETLFNSCIQWQGTNCSTNSTTGNTANNNNPSVTPTCITPTSYECDPPSIPNANTSNASTGYCASTFQAGSSPCASTFYNSCIQWQGSSTNCQQSANTTNGSTGNTTTAQTSTTAGSATTQTGLDSIDAAIVQAANQGTNSPTTQGATPNPVNVAANQINTSLQPSSQSSSQSSSDPFTESDEDFLNSLNSSN